MDKDGYHLTVVAVILYIYSSGQMFEDIYFANIYDLSDFNKMLVYWLRYYEINVLLCTNCTLFGLFRVQ